MNDLMTKSFLSYVELKKQAQLDIEQHKILDMGQLTHTAEQNLSQFFQQVELIKNDMQEINNLLLDLQTLNEETKSTYSAKILRGLRDRMNSNIVSVLRKAGVVKASLEALDKSNIANRKLSSAYAAGTAVDRMRVSTTNGMRSNLKDLMLGFQTLREKIMSDYREGLRRRFYNATGEYPSEEEVIEMVAENGRVEIFEGRTDMNLDNEEKHKVVRTDMNLENEEKHKVVMDIWRSLTKLHQVFLDMNVMVESQGDQINDIERNVAVAASFITGGTNSLFYANQMKKTTKKWICWVLTVGFIILLVCLVAMLAN